MKVAYGNRFLDVKLPSGCSFDLIEPPRTAPLFIPLHEQIEKAFQNPIDFPPLEEYLKEKSKILLVVPDGTRPCPLPEILPIIVESIQRLSHASIRIVVANGTHTPMTTGSLRQHVGAQIFDHLQIIQHNAYSKDMVEVGKTRRGIQVAINPILLDCEAILVVGPVQHHYFAGFGGGPKLIIPGLAALETTIQNHRLAISENGRLHPECREGIIDGNPVAEDICEAISLCPPVLHLGLILDERGQVIDVLAGDLQKTHRRLARKYHRAHLHIVNEQRPLVIASAGGEPRDCNLIQAHKGLHRASRLVKSEGMLVYFAECKEGIGSETFLPWFDFSSASKMASELTRNYTLNGHTALVMKEKTERIKIILVSDLPIETVSKMGMTPIMPVQSNLLNLGELITPMQEGNSWILPHAGEILPLPYDELRPEDSCI